MFNRLVKICQKYEFYLDVKYQGKQDESENKGRRKESWTSGESCSGSGYYDRLLKNKIKIAFAVVENGSKVLKACSVKLIVHSFKQG